MLEMELNAAEKKYKDVAENYLKIKSAHELAKANLQDAGNALQIALKESAHIRAAVLVGKAPQKKLTALRKKIRSLRQDLDELPGALDVLEEELKNAHRESSRVQGELDRLRAAKEYPIRLAEFVQAGNDDQKALGKLNSLAVQIGKGEEVRRLGAEIRAYSMGPRYRGPFTFVPDP